MNDNFLHWKAAEKQLLVLLKKSNILIEKYGDCIYSLTTTEVF